MFFANVWSVLLYYGSEKTKEKKTDFRGNTENEPKQQISVLCRRACFIP